MNQKNMEEKIISNFQQDENIMVLVFAQWCINNDLDPAQLYKQAYPDQGENPALLNGISLTVPKEEAGEIPDDTVLGVLSLFGNDDLAFIVSEEIKKRK
ncbi:hypothetical protein [Bacillus sp. FJAT-44742]|uniref:hypothetical protein n=1 Tax=Bacillus sp. FJAT-44742 TaxID=2014005 RepID=UPI000C241EE6|nr:hypothetical protein [Bacillus sp. FJAT-44742]